MAAIIIGLRIEDRPARRWCISMMRPAGRALHEIGIDIMCANTPAAKGRCTSILIDLLVHGTPYSSLRASPIVP
jgi:hypothetical protein